MLPLSPFSSTTTESAGGWRAAISTKTTTTTSIHLHLHLLALICTFALVALVLARLCGRLRPRQPWKPNPVFGMASLSPGPEAGLDQEALPFPGHRGLDGKLQVRYLAISGQRKATLKEWCQEFGLPHSGNIAQLSERLSAFSANRDGWERLLPGVRRSHKGPRPGTKKTTAKQSVRRREQLLNRGTTSASGVVLHALPTERSKDTRTAEEVEKLIPWAKNVTAMFPYRPPQPSLPPPQLPLALADGPSANPVAEPASSTPSTDPSEVTSIQQHMQLMNMSLNTILRRIDNITTDPNCQASHPSTPMTSATPDLSTSNGGGTRPPADQPAPIPLPPPAPLMRSLTLGSGMVIRFAETEVPDPAAVSFTTNIPRLNRMWDDTSAYWDGDSVTKILGHPIALVYWPEVYRYWKKDQWKGTKAKWFEWKVVVERWRKGSPEEFWSEFSVDGKHLSYTAIIKRLRALRLAEDQKLSEQAKVEYGNTFAASFSYRQGGRIIVMTDPTTIANHYRVLNHST